MIGIIASMAPAPGGPGESKNEIDLPDDVDIELDDMREYTNGYNDIVN